MSGFNWPEIKRFFLLLILLRLKATQVSDNLNDSEFLLSAISTLPPTRALFPLEIKPLHSLLLLRTLHSSQIRHAILNIKL